MKFLIVNKLNKKIAIIIKHTFDLPIGAGYGSSGAGALGIALGLNKILDLGLEDLEAAKYAHIAEVENHTGLGTAGGQFIGGFTLSIITGTKIRRS